MTSPGGPKISDLLLHACHDLRTSIRAIRTHAELLLKNCEGARVSVGFVVDGAKKIDLLVDGLTSYASALEIEEGSFQPIRMDVLLRNVLARLGKELRDNGAEVTYADLPCVRGDPDRLMELLENLLRNAVRHRSGPPPRISLTAEKRSDQWLLAIQDNGPGIEAAYLESIFKPFERLHGQESEGPGLGLAICRAIVERHGGTIWAASQAEKGCTIFFTLPAE